MTDDGIPRDKDGVPLFGPMADYITKAVAEVVRSNLHNMKTTCIVDLRGDKERMIAARKRAIEEWNATDRPPDPS